MGRAMKGGIGTASITMPDGLIVSALVATNAMGDVIDPDNGRVIAGTLTADRKSFADARKLLRSGAIKFRSGENTTLGVIATNAVLTKTQATRVAEMAHDGFARAIVPSHTPVDGDTIFTLATGSKPGVADDGAHRCVGSRRDGTSHRPSGATSNEHSGFSGGPGLP